MARSIRRRFTSRFSSLSSLRASVVRPSLRSPSSRSACLTQFRIVCSEGSNSRARDNALASPIPPEIGNLASLDFLSLSDNNALTGALPQTLTRVPLAMFYWVATQLCSPPNDAFQQWLQGIATHRGGPQCQ